MSAGAIALAAVIVLGAHDAAIVGALAWLVHKQRILLAASPRPPVPKQDKDAAGQQGGGKDNTVDLRRPA